jgi:hypothetical protein
VTKIGARSGDALFLRQDTAQSCEVVDDVQGGCASGQRKPRPNAPGEQTPYKSSMNHADKPPASGPEEQQDSVRLYLRKRLLGRHAVSRVRHLRDPQRDNSDRRIFGPLSLDGHSVNLTIDTDRLFGLRRGKIARRSLHQAADWLRWI